MTRRRMPQRCQSVEIKCHMNCWGCPDSKICKAQRADQGAQNLIINLHKMKKTILFQLSSKRIRTRIPLGCYRFTSFAELWKVLTQTPLCDIFFLWSTRYSVNGILQCGLGGQKIYNGEKKTFWVKCGLNADPFQSVCGLMSRYSHQNS